MSDTKNPLLTQEPPITAPASTISLATQQGRKRRRILPSTSPKFIVGAIIVVAIVLFAIIAPMFSQDPRSTANPALQPPSAEHWLGTTKLGNDMFAQLAIGAQGSLLIGVTAGSIAIVLVEQYLDFACELGDNFAVMDRGAVKFACDRSNLDPAEISRQMAL